MQTTRSGVAVSFRVSQEQREALDDAVGPFGVTYLADLDPASRPGAVGSAAALLAFDLSRELSGRELEALDGAGLLQLLSAGADRVPFDRLPPGMTVASNVGAYAEPMAEHVLAMALALAKRLPQKHAELARGKFQQFPPTRSLRGAVCGILGFGGIGQATARLMRPFGARIYAVNTTGRTRELAEWVGTLSRLDEVLRAADVLVVALPLTRKTRGLIGRRELELMKADAILVNVARGAIIDEGALYEHLRSHPDFMVGIDAWWMEPLTSGEFRVDHPFFDLPNFLGSPHNSAIVPGILVVAARRAAHNVARFLRGEPVRGIVNPEDYEDLEEGSGQAPAGGGP
jgi:phosphoglycerate dehydrogenase-like enzyme